MSTVGIFLVVFKGYSSTLLLLAGGFSSIGGTTATGVGGISLAKACLSSSYILALMSSISTPLMSSKVQFPP